MFYGLVTTTTTTITTITTNVILWWHLYSIRHWSWISFVYKAGRNVLGLITIFYVLNRFYHLKQQLILYDIVLHIVWCFSWDLNRSISTDWNDGDISWVVGRQWRWWSRATGQRNNDDDNTTTNNERLVACEGNQYEKSARRLRAVAKLRDANVSATLLFMNCWRSPPLRANGFMWHLTI